MKDEKIIFIPFLFGYFLVFAQDSSKVFQYNPDAGLQYRKRDFQCSMWAFAERLFSPSQFPAW